MYIHSIIYIVPTCIVPMLVSMTGAPYVSVKSRR